jgi:hypothetical protein
MKRLASHFLFAAMVALATMATAATALPEQPTLHVPPQDRRGEEQTYLTFPEWFLVFSPAEYADWLQQHPPTRFPFFAHIGQFWSAYGHVIAATRGRYPFNSEYHTMICVIGASTTVEYTIKGVYDTLIGRLSQFSLPANATPEDRLATRVERDYVDFIRVEPWYKFDFMGPLRKLWSDTPWWGPHALRKWERRYALSSEWLVKAAYGWMLGKAAHETYAIPKENTPVVARNAPADLPAGVQLLAQQGDEYLLALPRYQGFSDAATALARRGTTFEEIAGNRDTILVSVLGARGIAPPDYAPVFFTQPLLTKPGQQREVLQVPVGKLETLLNRYANVPGTIEHIFDY